MSTELYQNAMKDRNQLDQNNPRTSSLSSSDFQYKNFLAGMKPRNKKNSNGSNTDVSTNRQNNLQSSSFVESAARASAHKHHPTATNSNGTVKSSNKPDGEIEDEKAKAHKAMYAQFSKVPKQKSSDETYIENTEERKRSNSGNKIAGSKIQTESMGSVGKLRSIFDKHEETRPRLRSNGKRQERPLSSNLDYGKKSNVSGVYERSDSRENRKSLDIDMLTKSSEAHVEDNTSPKQPPPVAARSKPRQNSKTESDSDSGLSGSPQIAPAKKIDVSLLVAASDSSDHAESSDASSPKVNPRTANTDLQKMMEVDRLKRTQEEVKIEKRFGLKRRSLKERLSMLASEDDPYSVPDTYVTLANDKDSDKENDRVVPKKDSVPDSTVFKADVEEPIVENSVSLEESLPIKPNNNLSETETEIVKENVNDTSKYKSAVDRFDEFLTNEQAVPNKKSSDTDINQNLIKLQNGEDLQTYSDTETVTSDGSSKNDSNLLDSILSHIEQSDTSQNIDKDYISLLRTESLTEADRTQFENETTSQTSTQSDVKPSLNLEEPPAVLPRLSKQMAYNTQLSSSSSLVSDEETPVKEQPPVISSPIAAVQEASTASPSDRGSTTECDSDTTCSSVDEFHLPPPPPRSNLKTKSAEKKKKVIFKPKHLQQVMYTYGPDDYNRSNNDIDPIASSAEWELEKRVENMDVFSVDLHKDERGLGLSIIGLGVGTENGVEKLGIFVKTLTEKGAAQKDGRIQVNDQILEVNGVSLVGVTQYFAAQTLKGTNGVVRFLMGREKSRHTHLAPGAPLPNNTDMQKHVEEMNKILRQMEELEQRAINAEHTCDDVKIELLKAEERAHDTEQLLLETREQLKVVTESPFIGNQRKMKNEIKKKNGKQDKSEKIDELQRNLKNASERLSMSEENLLQLTTKNEEKDQEMMTLQTKVEESNRLLQQLEQANNHLNNELTSKLDIMHQLQADNENMRLGFEQQAKAQEEDRLNTTLQDQQRLEEGKGTSQDVDVKNQAMEREKSLQDQISVLQQDNTKLAEEIRMLRSQLQTKDTELALHADSVEKANHAAKDLRVKLQRSLEENENLRHEIEKLKEKSEYFLQLITKLEDSSRQGESSNKAYLIENQDLMAQEKVTSQDDDVKNQISALEEKLKEVTKKPKYFKDIPVAEEISVKSSIDVESIPQFDSIAYVEENVTSTPALYVESSPDSPPHSKVSVPFDPPLIERSTKPSSTKLTARVEPLPSVQQDVKPPTATVRPLVTSVAPVDNTINQHETIVTPITVDVVENANPTLSFDQEHSIDSHSPQDVGISVDDELNETLKEDLNLTHVNLGEISHDLGLDSVQADSVNATPPIDLGLSVDANSTTDLGLSVDGNPTTDLGLSVDADPTTDLGLSVDADPLQDVGLSVDSPTETVDVDTNPVPKPPRGHFVSSDDDFVIVESPTQDKPELSLELSSTQNKEEIGLKEGVLENSLLVQGVSDSIIVSAVKQAATTPEREQKSLLETLDQNQSVEATTSEKPSVETTPKKDMHMKYLQQSNNQGIDIDTQKSQQQPQFGVNIENEADKGQFELVTEEIQDETATPDLLNSRKTKEHKDRSSFFEALNQEPRFNEWLDDEWKRLDSTARDERAEIIAAQGFKETLMEDNAMFRRKRALSKNVDVKIQVTARSPTKRKDSLASSSSSDEDGEDDDADDSKPRPTRKSIKIDASYFQQTPAGDDSFDHEISILDDENPTGDIQTEGTENEDDSSGIVKSLSFDSAIPVTAPLDNKSAHDKLQLLKGMERKKPTQGARGSLALQTEDDYQISTLPRNNQSKSTPNLLTTGATSTPNLLASGGSVSSSNIEKHEKQGRSKFSFHLPKVFKKGKVHKKQSAADPKNSPPQVEKRDVDSPSPVSTHSEEVPKDSPKLHLSVESSQPQIVVPTVAEKSPVMGNDSEVVPLEQKVDAETQQKANDAATEEAVVPFADKEEVMVNGEKGDIDLKEEPAHAPNFIANIQVQHDTRDDASIHSASIDEVQLEIPVTNGESTDLKPRTVSTVSSAADEPRTASNASSTPSSTGGQYNERGIDVGNNDNDLSVTSSKPSQNEEEAIQHWTRRAAHDWDVRQVLSKLVRQYISDVQEEKGTSQNVDVKNQVGLWLVEMNLSQYVNSFKDFNVDGRALLRADGNKLKDYGVHNTEHRAEIKKRIKEFRSKLSKDSFNKGKNKDHKSTKDRLQFWKGKYKVH